jgi:hypothetical protein
MCAHESEIGKDVPMLYDIQIQQHQSEEMGRQSFPAPLSLSRRPAACCMRASAGTHNQTNIQRQRPS